MFEKWRAARAQTPELNLIPVMNLMVVLIPLLLLGAAFFHISVIPTSIASDGSGGEPSPKVTLKLDISRVAMTLSGHSGDPSVDPASLAAAFPIADGKLDLDGLQAKLSEIKTRFPSSDTLVLTPFDDLPYQVLVTVVDAAREKLVLQGPGRESKRVALFPLIVFARPGMVDEGAQGAGPEEGAP